ncbi:putative UBX domain protein [Annulohypoxylon maeteangense]|uniref:putative UBX domain protein n=1 Tax=Annulohypoxylon maeteangense TaxID=1927788 RepID=UPI002007250D|nr:putative UBX domain protein [Annulohypoxylon maeteangense]KAI0890050.1 putative UBX domain protein [Annulohypoxylon maeteangense]
MATNVKVVGTDLKQVTIKVNPGTYLTDILEQACEKLKVPSSKYLLKHKQKQLDLSNTWRTSGLVPGAKLELVVRSNTPTAINVALQFPPPESNLFPPSGRVTEKLPSDFTLWKLLRQFESGKSSQGKNLNITGRGVAQTNNGMAVGSGQLYYETPVLTIENRTLSTFADFQKTLSQLGYNSGSVLIRLSFRKTDCTLVDAMAEMSRHFKAEEEDRKTESNTGSTRNNETLNLMDAMPEDNAPGIPSIGTPQTETSPIIQEDITSPSTTQAPATNVDAMDIDVPSADNRPVTIFSAPASGTPLAALRADSDDAFAPRIEHAQAHQRLLKTAGENKRLLSDKELEAKAAAEAARVSAVKSIQIKVRFPDNFSAEWPFGPDDTGAALYAEVRKVMANETAPFKLALPPGKVVIRDDDSGPTSKLIGGYRLSSNTLVNFMWDEKVPVEVRKQPFLKGSAVGRAQTVVVPEEPPDVVDEAGPSSHVPAPAPKPSSGGDGSGFKKPKWLKGLGGKK